MFGENGGFEPYARDIDLLYQDREVGGITRTMIVIMKVYDGNLPPNT